MFILYCVFLWQKSGKALGDLSISPRGKWFFILFYVFPKLTVSLGQAHIFKLQAENLELLLVKALN